MNPSKNKNRANKYFLDCHSEDLGADGPGLPYMFEIFSK